MLWSWRGHLLNLVAIFLIWFHLYTFSHMWVLLRCVEYHIQSYFVHFPRIKREAEAKRIWEELQAKEEERKRAEEMLRQRLLFQRSLNVESHGLEHSHDMSRAFVFSYYELLKWLGYEIPEWAQYGLTPSNSNDSHDAQHNQWPSHTNWVVRAFWTVFVVVQDYC